MKRSVDKKISGATGAPPAYFLLLLVTAPSVLYLIESTRAERASLATEPTKEISKRVWFQLLELASRVAYPTFNRKHLENAAEDLALVATTAASLLEDLARTDAKPEIMLAAMRKNRWPVNLQLGVKRKNGETSHTLEGAEKAKEYLVSIQLGQSPTRILKHLHDPGAKPFARAAELLLLALRDFQERGAWRADHRENAWSRELVSLEYPMTADNKDRWWSVAKQWMDEQWETNREFFNPLIESCKSKGKPFKDAPLYESEKKSRVIDLRLKEAFFALVKPADL